MYYKRVYRKECMYVKKNIINLFIWSKIEI